jgi:flagellar biosynthesis protein FlhG
MDSNVTKLDFSHLRGRSEPGSVIIAVGGGKGGVGKSFVSSSIAIILAQMGFETVAVDLDLGSANLHTCFGAPLNDKGINEFITDPGLEFRELLQPTHWPKLKLISGSSENLDSANVTDMQRSRVMSAIYRNRADFTILDLSAGTHNSTLDFFLMAQHKMVVFTPDPSSVENAYRFLKGSYFRKLRRYEYQLQMKAQIDELLAERAQHGIRNPADLIRVLSKRDPNLGMRVKHLMSDVNFQIILNQARTRQEIDLGHALQSTCTKYFGAPCEFLGGLEYDNAVWQSLRQKNHLLMANRQSHLYAQLMSIARKIAKAKQVKVAA